PASSRRRSRSLSCEASSRRGPSRSSGSSRGRSWSMPSPRRGRPWAEGGCRCQVAARSTLQSGLLCLFFFELLDGLPVEHGDRLQLDRGAHQIDELVHVFGLAHITECLVFID